MDRPQVAAVSPGLGSALDISYDDFIRTTETPGTTRSVQKFLTAIYDNGLHL